ncbi:MAG TPA: pyridoxamine 5'-phosphate oxidase family protein [Vicinamibacterales bacterium]|nr:pyridoxamine 5'-phosphate oxidase family protein [Vicinamibacterales bacterium]
MTTIELLTFLRAHRYAVEASVSRNSGVQAAVVGIAVLDTFEIVFDTLATSRKARNLEEDPRVALVIGGLSDDEQSSVQYEGVADRPAGAELRDIQEHYFHVFPDGRDRLAWPNLIHLRVRPQWMRYSDFAVDPPLIVEMTAEQIGLRW